MQTTGHGFLGARNDRYQIGTSKFLSYIWGQKEVTRRQGRLYSGYGSTAFFFLLLSKILPPSQCGVSRQVIIVEDPAADLPSDWWYFSPIAPVLPNWNLHSLFAMVHKTDVNYSYRDITHTQSVSISPLQRLQWLNAGWRLLSLNANCPHNISWQLQLSVVQPANKIFSLLLKWTRWILSQNTRSSMGRRRIRFEYF